MIDLTGSLTLKRVSQIVPGRDGERCHVSTVLRWVLKGVKRNGVRIRLEAVRVGGRYLVQPEALDRFIQATTGGSAAEALPRTEPQKLRASEAAGAALDQAGV